MVRAEGLEVDYKGMKAVHNSADGGYSAPADIGGVLIQEFVIWFGGLLETGTVMPKMFTGVNRDGSQFIIDFSRLNMDSSKHLDFMRYVLHEEGSIAFAFKMRVAVEVCKEPQIIQEQHMFYAGSSGHYHYVSLTSKAEDGWQDGYKVVSERNSAQPEVFFQELLPEHFKRQGDLVEFAGVWKAIRNYVFWRKRGL
jgi:hypothetical protein